MNIQKDILKSLKYLSNTEYLEFSKKLIPNAGVPILGVKIPLIRKLAKDISKRVDIASFLSSYNPKFHEEYLLKAIIINSIKDINLELIYANKFVKSMPNWGVCDTFCIKKNKNLEIYQDFLNEFKHSKKEFEGRFYYMFFMKNFLNLESLDDIFTQIKQEKSELYYVKMAIAWLLCESYIIDKEKTANFILETLQDDFIKTKAISKIKDSFRIKISNYPF